MVEIISANNELMKKADFEKKYQNFTSWQVISSKTL